MQALLGKTGAQGLKRRIHTHDLKTVKQDWIDQVNDLLKDVDLAEMENISEGAAIFYSWCNVTIMAKTA